MFNPKTEGRGRVSNLVFYAQSVITVISRRGGGRGRERERERESEKEQFAQNNYIALLWGILFLL